MSEDIRIHMRHLRACGYCVPAAKSWCEANGIDWKEFVRDGLPVTVADSVGDLGARTAAAKAREEAENGRRG